MLSSAALLLVCTLMYVLVIGLFVLFPPYHKVSGVGAVMSLAPQAERLPTAAQHYGNGGAQYIVISRPLGSVTTDPSVIPSLADNLCRSEDISIICLPPDGADTTLGEARMLARLVSEREWNSLVIVTSSDHAFRAGQIFKMCLGPEVEVMVSPVPVDYGIIEWMARIFYESAAYFKALFETPVACS